MRVKKLVKIGGSYVERYVDLGKGRAVVGHGAPMRIVDNQRIGPARSRRAA